MSVTILIVDVVREGIRTINRAGPSGKSAVKLLTVKGQSIRPLRNGRAASNPLRKSPSSYSKLVPSAVYLSFST
jgi:hypothetical protein